jgi:hypothetical protein
MRGMNVQPFSACVNAGSPAWVQGSWPDLDGQTRTLGAAVDIGADESDGTPWNVTGARYHVRPGGSDAADGLSWATAKRSPAASMQRRRVGRDLVAAGTTPSTSRSALPAVQRLRRSETERSQRNVAANPTILDGGGTPTVVTSENAGYLASTVDGFTIQNGGHWCGGNLWDIVPTTARGAGIFSLVSGPLIANNVIRRNSTGTPFDPMSPIPEGGGIALPEHRRDPGNEITENEILGIDGRGGANG